MSVISMKEAEAQLRRLTRKELTTLRRCVDLAAKMAEPGINEQLGEIDRKLAAMLAATRGKE